MKYSIRLISITIVNFIIIVVTIIIIHSNTAADRDINEKQLTQTYEVIDVSKDLLNSTFEAESTIKDFIITADTAFLEPFRNTIAHNETFRLKLKNLTTGIPVQQLRLDTLQTLFFRHSVVAEQIILAINENEVTQKTQIDSSLDSKKIIDQINNVINRFIDEEQTLFIKYREDADRLNHNTFLTLIIGMATGFIMLGFILVLLYRENQARKIESQELFLKNQWFNNIMISLGDGLIAIDAQGIINMINPSAALITGWKQQQALGSHIDKIFEITDEKTGLKVVNPAIKAMQENKMIPLGNHTFLEQKNGNNIHIDDSGAPIYNEKGQVVGAVLIFRDVTDKKKAEDALHDLNLSLEKKVYERTIEVVKSERRLKEAQKISQTGNWEIDLITNKNSWSDEFYNIFDLVKDSIQPSIKSFLKLISSSDRAMVHNKIQQGLNTLKGSNLIFRFTGKEGVLKYGYINWQFENDKNNKPIRLYGILQDITERKAARKKLQLQNIELKKTNAELDKFVYSSSHDLRAPLASVLGLINIIDSHMGSDDIEQKERIDMMKQSIIKLDSFIEDIINYSRNSRMEIEKDEINFEALINQSRQSLKYMSHDSEFKINVKVTQKGKFISDKRRILVNLNNLISNAIKYRDTTKINSHVDITVYSDISKAIIKVKDNGLGIADDKKGKIFEMFYRGNKFSDGSGLGMYIAKETLTKLNGTITLESKLNVGTTFTVIIPNLIEIS